ncbi:MAG: tol-pal system protein YbgF [Planctomycetes bacterium ADurb.Bin126]|nr:MAG: tol-pal system protein YbgF [Planctomycetes bacterium ADurb.Bin126]
MHAETGSQGGIRFVTLLLAVVLALGLAWPAAARAGPVGAASPARWLAPLALAAPAKAKAKPAAKPSAREATKAGAAPKTGQLAPRGEQARDEKLYKALTAAWSQFYANKLKDAAATVEPLIASEVEWARVEALHIQARCLHAAGPQYHARAAQTWSRLQAQSTLNANLIRLEVGKALAALAAKPSAGEAPKGRPADAAATLDAALRRGIPGTCTPEAAIELGRAYVAQKQWDNAKKAFEFAIAYSQSQARTNKELPGYVYDPFIAEAKEAIAHLKYDRNEGREEFERAEKLRADKKYAEAGKLYQAVAKKYPESTYAPRSELHTGHCLLGLGEPRQAVQHWQKFISAQPSGPWRGQAYSEIIDLCLQTVFDLDNAVRFAQLAQSSLGPALGDKSAAASWQAGMFDLQLGLGIVAFIRNDNPAAAAAFARAASAAPKTVKKNFPALIAAAKAGKPLLPPEVSAFGPGAPSGAGSPSGSSQSTIPLALAMGRIYRIAGEEDASRRMFALVASAKLGRPSPAQLAYARFATGDALDADKKHAQAKDEYVESLKAFPRGSWQDESLFRVARFIQNEADRKYGMVTSVTHAKDPDSKEERERLKKLTDASAASLEYWSLLVQHFPQSRHRETALFQAARIFADTRKWPDAVAMADKLAAEYPNSKSAPKLLYEIGAALAAIQQWPDAVKIADRLAAAYPKEPFAPKLLHEVGAALLKAGKFKDTTDLAEKMIAAFPKDPNGPKLFYDMGIMLCDMAEKGDPTKTETLWKHSLQALSRFCALAPDTLEAGDAHIRRIDISLERLFDRAAAESLVQTATSWADKQRQLGYSTSAPGGQQRRLLVSSCFLRAGIVAYLAGDYERARKMFEAGGPADPSNGDLRTFELDAKGFFLLRKAMQRRMSLSLDGALASASDDRQAIAVQLADLYLYIGHTPKAAALFSRISSQDPSLGQRGNSMLQYAQLQTALIRSETIGGAADAIQMYRTFYDKQYADSRWAPKALLRLGVLTYNTTQDPGKAMPHYEYVFTRYPNDQAAERAMYLYCLAAARKGDSRLAQQSAERFLKSYPTSPWRSHVTGMLQELGQQRKGLHR